MWMCYITHQNVFYYRCTTTFRFFTVLRWPSVKFGYQTFCGDLLQYLIVSLHSYIGRLIRDLTQKGRPVAPLNPCTSCFWTPKTLWERISIELGNCIPRQLQASRLKRGGVDLFLGKIAVYAGLGDDGGSIKGARRKGLDASIAWPP